MTDAPLRMSGAHSVVVFQLRFGPAVTTASPSDSLLLSLGQQTVKGEEFVEDLHLRTLDGPLALLRVEPSQNFRAVSFGRRFHRARGLL